MKQHGTKRLFAALMALCMVLVLLPVTAAQADDEIEIANYEQLKAFAARVNGGETTLNAKLTADFVCKNSPDDTEYADDWTPIGQDKKHIYTGKFDGNNCTITGLTCNMDDTAVSPNYEIYTGMFGVLGNDGTVKDLYLKDCSLSVTAGESANSVHIGAIVGESWGTITNCCVFGTSTVSGTHSKYKASIDVGGIAGLQQAGTISNCCFTGTGEVFGSAVDDAEHDSTAFVGGIAGLSASFIESCFHAGTVRSSAGNLTVAGGIAGYYAGHDLKNCRHTGSVKGAYGTRSTWNTMIGGVIGWNLYSGIVSNCYARSTVEATGHSDVNGDMYIGGVAGANQHKNGVTQCCYDTTLAPEIVPSNDILGGSCIDVVGIASEAFTDESNYSKWENFSANWVMGDEQPELIALSVPVHLYADSNEDIVISRVIPVCTPIVFTNPFTYEGYKFIRWNTEADGNGDPYSETDEFTLLRNETLTLHAQWREIVSYPFWVGGVQATSENADDVLGDGTVQFEITEDGENVLTLTNAKITGVYTDEEGWEYNLFSNESEYALTIRLVGENSMSGAYSAVETNGALLFVGSGSLAAEAVNDGISTYGSSITFDGPIVETKAGRFGIWAISAAVTVKGNGKLTAEGTENYAVFAKAIEIGDGLFITMPEGATIGESAGAAVFLNSDGSKVNRVVIGPAYIITFVDENGTELQKGLVAAGTTPAYTGETPTKAPTVEHLYTFAGWTLPNSGVILETLPVVEGEATYVAAYTESDRAYTGPVWAWNGYESATATFTAADNTTFTQVVTAEGDAITDAVTTPPTCTEKGERTYTATVTFLGQTYTDDKTEPIDATGHNWGEPTYAWVETESGYTVMAETVCINNPEHVIRETVEAAYETITEPEVFVDGLGRYTATFENTDHFTEQTKDVVIPMLRPTFCASETNSLDTYVIEDGEMLYPVEIRVINLPGGAIAIDSAQIFLNYDHDALAFVKGEGIVDWEFGEKDGGLYAVWASEAETAIADGDVVLTLYFRKADGIKSGEMVRILFTVNPIGNTSAISYVEDNAVKEIEMATIDGFILYEMPVLGDVNCDGVITSADAALILRSVVGLSTLTPRSAANADTDGDGEVTAADAALVLRYVVGLIDAFPAEP